MIDYLEILRFNNLGYSQRTIETTAHCSRHTVREVLAEIDKHAIQWPVDDDITNADPNRMRFPDKYNTWIEQGGSNVSGGQKQRLTIARALLRKPKVLILDDSTSAVDTATDAKIRKAFREEIPGTTKIIIAQRISSVQDADRILVLDNGKIDGLGTHEELLKTNAIYQEVYNSQTQGGGDFDKQGGEQ